MGVTKERTHIDLVGGTSMGTTVIKTSSVDRPSKSQPKGKSKLAMIHKTKKKKDSKKGGR